MREEVRLHEGLAELAESQYGVVTHEQLRQLDYSKSAIFRALSAQRLHLVHRGVYAVGHRGISRHGHCLAGVLACGGGALLSHESAAWLWGLLPHCPMLPEVTTPARGNVRATVRRHHSTIIEADDRALHESIPTTSVARTLLDLAARNRRRDLGRAVERAERLALLDLAAIDALIARSGGHRGRRRLRTAMNLYRDPAFSRSWHERRFLALVKKAGLPRPAVNTFVAGYEIDAYWERERFAVEVDGYETHGSRSAFEEDRVRQETLKLADIDSVRITARRIEREPDQVAARLRQLLERRRQTIERQQ